jgi:hypothetical protein
MIGVDLFAIEDGALVPVDASLCKALHGPGASSKAREKVFKADVAGLGSDRGAVPSRVVYPTPSPKPCNRLGKALQRTVGKLVKRFGGNKACRTLKVLLHFKCTSESGRESNSFALAVLDLNVKTAGLFKATQGLLKLEYEFSPAAKDLDDVIDINGISGMELCMSRRLFVAVRAPSHLSTGVQLGALDFQTTQDFARTLTSPGGDDTIIAVSVCRCDFAWAKHRQDCLVAGALDDSVGPTEIRVSDLQGCKDDDDDDDDDDEPDWAASMPGPSATIKAPSCCTELACLRLSLLTIG